MEVFETSDPDRAHEFLVQAYVDNHMVVNKTARKVRFRHSRQGIGLFFHDDYDNSMDLSFATQPLGHLLIAKIRDGRFERDTAGAWPAHQGWLAGQDHPAHSRA
jgi:hypothetical protein